MIQTAQSAWTEFKQKRGSSKGALIILKFSCDLSFCFAYIPDLSWPALQSPRLFVAQQRFTLGNLVPLSDTKQIWSTFQSVSVFFQASGFQRKYVSSSGMRIFLFLFSFRPFGWSRNDTTCPGLLRVALCRRSPFPLEARSDRIFILTVLLKSHLLSINFALGWVAMVTWSDGQWFHFF